MMDVMWEVKVVKNLTISSPTEVESGLSTCS